ncbi:hypothetical protein B0O80DRAFT_498330 [Mortierella sp. GBAus27b]|nr:hypothetical protein B0O80DRAFT_498330 [Mortierella sp. GBAus27b]
MSHRLRVRRFWIQPTLSEYDEDKELRKLELIRGLNIQSASPTTITMVFGSGGLKTSVKIDQMETINSADYATVFRRYGWSFVALHGSNGVIDDRLALLLDQSTQERGSKLNSLSLDLESLSLTGLRCMDQVIRRSKRFQQLAMLCTTSGVQHERESVHWFMGQHGKALTTLNMKVYGSGAAVTRWIEQVLPSRSGLPRLNEILLGIHGSEELGDSSSCVNWLVGMTSPPPYSATETTLEESRDRRGTTPGSSWISLKRLCLYRLKLNQDDWRMLLKAIDFSTLTALDFSDSNFTLTELQLLVNHLGLVYSAPLKALSVTNTPLSKQCNQSGEKVSFVVATLKERVPSIRVTGLK